jgi:rhamnosyltransferase
MSPAPAIAAVIPAFHPEPGRFREMLSALAPQCGSIFVVDNGGAGGTTLAISRDLETPVEVLGDGKNLGVAAAQNLGIRRALASGAHAVLFMDQDSVAHADLVAHLSAALETLRSQGRLVAACGPRYHEPGSKRLSGFVHAGRFRLRTILPPRGEPSVPCDFLISSGMLVPTEALRAVGEMEEALFIDHVDTEWCFRAKRSGFGCHGVAAACMEHELGRSRKKIWLGRWRQVPEHPPERLYFLARNTVWLSRRPYIPPACKQHLITRLVGLALFGLLVRQDRRLRLRRILLGIRAGFQNL